MYISFLDDTYCHLCESFSTKKEWNKHLWSTRHLLTKAHTFWTGNFLNRKLTGDESTKPEKNFCKMFFATKNNRELDELLITCILMSTTLGACNFDYEEVRNEFSGIMEEQFEHD